MQFGDKVLIRSKHMIGHVLSIDHEKNICVVVCPKLNSKDKTTVVVNISEIAKDFSKCHNLFAINNSKVAVFIRNEEIAKRFLGYCGYIGIFWNGQSRNPADYIPSKSEFCVCIKNKHLLWGGASYFLADGWEIRDAEEYME